VVEIESDRQQFAPHGVNTGVVEFAIMQAGKPKLERKATLRAADSTPNSKVALYVDRDSPVAYRVSWHSASGSHEDKLAVLDSDYLFLTPPALQDSSTAAH
jgi:hypothetical protein